MHTYLSTSAPELEIQLSNDNPLICKVCGVETRLIADFELEADTWEYSLEHVWICRDCLELILNKLNELDLNK